MCTIKVFLRKSTTNKEGKHPIKLRLYQGQKSKEISIKGAWLYEREFNAKRQRANNNKEVNLKIQKELAKYYNAITKLSSFENEFDLNDIYNYANNITPKKKAKKVNLHIIEYVLEQIVTDHENYSYGTRRHYKAFTNLLRKLNINPLLSNIDSSFLKSFEQRLIRETPMKQGTIWNKCKMMKAAVNHAFNQDYIHSPNWKRSKQLRIDKGRIMKGGVLTEEQLELLHHYKCKTELDKKIKESYLFTYFSGGLRFSDICLLKYTNIHLEDIGGDKRHVLRYVQKKTAVNVMLPISDKSLRYIDQSMVGKDVPVFTYLKNTDYLHGKEHLAKCIEKSNSYANKRLKIIMRQAGIKGNYTFHSSRRGFISRCIKLGIHNNVIMDMSGLRTSKILDQHYAKISGGQLLDAVNRL